MPSLLWLHEALSSACSQADEAYVQGYFIVYWAMKMNNKIPFTAQRIV